MKHRSVVCIVSLLIVLFLRFGQVAGQDQIAQAAPSATPARALIPTATVPSKSLDISDSQQATFTPTGEGPARMRMNIDTVSYRIPDPEGEQAGSLRAEEIYTITGRFFQWYQFDDPDDNRREWVHESYVTILGNNSGIPEVNPFAAPTPEVNADTQNPSSDPSDPNARVIAAPTSPSAAETLALVDNSPDNKGRVILEGQAALPTYTYPPDAISPVRTRSPGNINFSEEASPTPDLLPEIVSAVIENGVPPFAPIMALGGLGVLGLIISVLFRR